eukprot:2772857-Amphidinium_carterae.1
MVAVECRHGAPQLPLIEAGVSVHDGTTLWLRELERHVSDALQVERRLVSAARRARWHSAMRRHD